MAWFGGKILVAQFLTSSEIVLAWDVPEKLGMLAGSDEGQETLMSEPFTPLKIWHRFCILGIDWTNSETSLDATSLCWSSVI